ncbi:hypothetical protein [Micromonospora peucetia]|uniref:Uncharacterized protein n=1 Tax=Micromonospora peucetia TaxID=47871 RepID=A0ABZ1ECI2_9ACTN|nr:hypothetical protein [Micromonospora peucetia]WSA31301.1 hypothetical protein OIE14_24655 [Micromonospora peucetia]
MSVRALLRPAAVALVVVLAASGCTSATSSTESTASTTVTEAPDDAASAPGAVATTNAPGGSGTATTSAPGGSNTGPTGGGSKGGGSTGGGTGSSGSQSGTKSSGPTIAYFRVAHKPSCPAGTNINPIAGTPVLVEWKASNVDSVALSIDGPGVYADDYPAAGSEAFNFPCSGGGGDIQKHTYLLTVRNAHGTQTKTLVVSARVHDIPVV